MYQLKKCCMITCTFGNIQVFRDIPPISFCICQSSNLSFIKWAVPRPFYVLHLTNQTEINENWITLKGTVWGRESQFKTFDSYHLSQDCKLFSGLTLVCIMYRFQLNLLFVLVLFQLGDADQTHFQRSPEAKKVLLRLLKEINA